MWFLWEMRLGYGILQQLLVSARMGWDDISSFGRIKQLLWKAWRHFKCHLAYNNIDKENHYVEQYHIAYCCHYLHYRIDVLFYLSLPTFKYALKL